MKFSKIKQVNVFLSTQLDDEAWAQINSNFIKDAMFLRLNAILLRNIRIQIYDDMQEVFETQDERLFDEMDDQLNDQIWDKMNTQMYTLTRSQIYSQIDIPIEEQGRKFVDENF